MDSYTKIHNQYVNLASYTATVTMTVRSNKTENTYVCRQFYKADGRYRMEFTAPDNLAGLVNIVNGTQGYTGFPGTDRTFSIEQLQNTEGNYLFLDQFFANYYQSEETAMSVSGTTDSSQYTVLETEIIGQNAKHHTMSLSIRNDDLLPHRLTVCDMGGREMVTAVFSDVKLNPSIPDALFVAEQ